MSGNLQTTWTIPLQEAGDGSGDAIIYLPDELLESLGWSVGDELMLDIVDSSIKIVKSSSPN